MNTKMMLYGLFFVAIIIVMYITIMNLVDFNNEAAISINTIDIQFINNTKTPQLVQYTQSKPIHTTDTTLQPKLIVVASINSGTSTLTQIFMYHLKGFFHSFKESQDSKYWNQCLPKQYIKAIKFIQNIIENKPNNISFSLIFNSHIKHNKNMYINNWDSSFNHLINNNDRIHRNDQKCTHKDYMKIIGYNLSKHQYEKERKHIFFRNLSEMIDHRNYHRWPNESNYNKLSEIHFYWDRASCYNGYPYIPSILSTNYPYTKLLYAIRDPLFQMYSNIRIFDEKTTGQKLVKVNEDTLMLSEEEANRRMNKLLKMLNSDFYLILFDLLKQNVSEKNENEILLWYVMLWAKNDNGKGSYKDQRVFDKCSYVNVLLYIKSGQIFNTIYGIKHFKLIQFEWETNNLLLASLYIYC
eukprot:518088_1